MLLSAYTASWEVCLLGSWRHVHIIYFEEYWIFICAKFPAITTHKKGLFFFSCKRTTLKYSHLNWWFSNLKYLESLTMCVYFTFRRAKIRLIKNSFAKLIISNAVLIKIVCNKYLSVNQLLLVKFRSVFRKYAFYFLIKYSVIPIT